MKSAAGLAFPLIRITGTWKHAATIGRPGRIMRVTPRGFSSASGYAPTRFNPGNQRKSEFETLYLALDRTTALLEKRAQFGDPYVTSPVFIAGPRMTNTEVIDVEVELRSIVDLTDLTSHALIESSAQELTGDWKGYEWRGLSGPQIVLTAPVGEAPTQALGWELFHTPHIEGMKVISAEVSTTCCLVIFTQKLFRPGSLTWNDSNTGQRERYP